MPRNFTPGGPASPTLNFSEDLKRFPSESLHSFSFAHQSEDVLHNRQNVLRRSIDFLRERLGWAANHPGLLTAQAKVNGDLEVQGVMELLARANVLGNEPEGEGGYGNHGPLTGPALVNADNLFDGKFALHSEKPGGILDMAAAAASSPESTNGRLSDPEPAQPTSTSDTANAPSSPAFAKSSTHPDLRRTYTDVAPLALQTRLMDALAKPYIPNDSSDLVLSPTTFPDFGTALHAVATGSMNNHSHVHRWSPAAQAIFTTETHAPWTILAANDLACLVFGVTKAEVKKLGILEVVREDRRNWLEDKLKAPGSEAAAKARASYTKSQRPSPSPSMSMAMGGGITALLLRKPPVRKSASRRSQTDDGSGSSYNQKKAKGGSNHHTNKSRGVLLCGDVVPIQKRNGATGSASLWVKDKRGTLIWVLEEIMEDVAFLTLDGRGKILVATGSTSSIWGDKPLERADVRRLIPWIPLFRDSIDYAALNKLQHFTARHPDGYNVPVSASATPTLGELRVSSFPHIAGIMVLSAVTLEVSSSNSVFSAALFGYPNPDGLPITKLIPNFDKILQLLREEERVSLVDGIVIPEHSFRRARALLALRDGTEDASSIFLQPSGLAAKHRDGSKIYVDVQLRVVKSHSIVPEESIIEESEGDDGGVVEFSELVYALWITYSRHLHSAARLTGSTSPLLPRLGTPPRQPSPGQPVSLITSQPMDPEDISKQPVTTESLLTQQIREATAEPMSPPAHQLPVIEIKSVSATKELPKKKTISEFVVLEEMGQGAYGQVKLCREKRSSNNKVVIKFVTKKRILVDTWTRDRKLGTVPLEIHVLDYLRKDGLKHPNIVEMTDFFEDNANYYIQMVPHGLPGMDLFDYIEMRSTMEEAECRNIFLQVVAALHHLHTKALVVHRDIKDENIVLDGNHRVKLIDFGSAAYIKNGPFDVFVGTIG
jgi:protein-serine/threonine kinase